MVCTEPVPLDNLVEDISQMDAQQLDAELECNSDENLLVLLKVKLKNIKGWLLAPPRDSPIHVGKFM